MGFVRWSSRVLTLQLSGSLLGSFDILFAHVPSDATQAQAQALFKDSNVIAELRTIRYERLYGVSWLGVSLSHVSVWEDLLESPMWDCLDAIQVPTWLASQQPNLLSRSKSKKIIVNSTVRYRQEGLSPLQAMEGILAKSEIDVVLCGSRRHYMENIELTKQ